MLWAVLSLISGLGDATVYALLKRFRNQHGLVVIWLQYAVAFPFLLIALLFFIPETVRPMVFFIGLINAALLALTDYLIFKATQSGDLSLTAPLLSLTPLFLIVTSFLMLGELPRNLGFVGIGLIVIGAYVINYRSTKDGVFHPFAAIFRKGGPRYAVLAAFIMSILSNLFKIGISESNVFFFPVLVYLLTMLVLLPFIWNHFGALRKFFFENKVAVLGMGLANAVMQICAAIAVMLTIVPYMISLKRSSTIFSIIYGKVFFKEKAILMRVIGAGIMVIGGMLILFS